MDVCVGGGGGEVVDEDWRTMNVIVIEWWRFNPSRRGVATFWFGLSLWTLLVRSGEGKEQSIAFFEIYNGLAPLCKTLAPFFNNCPRHHKGRRRRYVHDDILTIFRLFWQFSYTTFNLKSDLIFLVKINCVNNQ